MFDGSIDGFSLGLEGVALGERVGFAEGNVLGLLLACDKGLCEGYLLLWKDGHSLGFCD